MSEPERSFEAYVHARIAALSRIAFLLTGDRYLAEDLVQQALLRYFEDLTEAQAAEVLGCRVGTVKSQVRDALARLRTLVPELTDRVGEETRR